MGMKITMPHSDKDDREAGACKWQEAEPKERGAIIIGRLLDEKSKKKPYNIGIFLDDNAAEPMFILNPSEALRMSKVLVMLAELPKKELL